MPGPLNGYRIVDLTANVAGPLATMILGDQGAEVIKVEAPDGGDATRAGADRRGGFSASFLNNNRNKRSVVLDLKTAGGLQALTRLVAGADPRPSTQRAACAGHGRHHGSPKLLIRRAGPGVLPPGRSASRSTSLRAPRAAFGRRSAVR